MLTESYRLAELKYAIFSMTGRKTKKLLRSKLFLWTVFKHRLLEGSTILLQYSAITRTPLESSPLGELKDAISPGYNVRPKNKSIQKCKKWHCTVSIYGHSLWTGSDRFGQVRTSQNRCEVLFFLNHELHTVQIWPIPNLRALSNRTSLETLRSSEVVETALRHASIGARCELVWSATFLGSTSKSDTSSLESSRLAEFECEILPGYELRQKSYGF